MHVGACFMCGCMCLKCAPVFAGADICVLSEFASVYVFVCTAMMYTVYIYVLRVYI